MWSKHMRRALLGTFDRQDRFLDAGHLGRCDGLEKRALRQSTRMTMKAMMRLKISSASFRRPKSGEVKSAYHRQLRNQQHNPRTKPQDSTQSSGLFTFSKRETCAGASVASPVPPTNDLRRFQATRPRRKLKKAKALTQSSSRGCKSAHFCIIDGFAQNRAGRGQSV
jgi:hypothetical protein